MYTVGVCLKHFVCVCVVPFCSISATMLTCRTPPRTPPQPSPSQHKVQLHIDGVIREAPVSYTYNENPHISSIQPKHSFIRSAPQPTFSCLTCAWSWGSTGRVLKYAYTCVHSGGSTVTVNGFYLHSALQPQMVLTAATEGKLFQMVVSVHSPHRVPRHQIPLFPCHRHVSIINPTEQRSRSADLRNKGSNVSQLHSWRGNGKITHLINNVLNKYVCHFFFPLSKFLNSFLETFQLFLCSFF